MNLSLGVLNAAPHKQGKFKVFYSGFSFAFVLRDRPPQFQLDGLSARSMFGIARRSSRFQATAEQSPFKGCLFSEVKWRKSAEKNAGGKKRNQVRQLKKKETPASWKERKERKTGCSRNVASRSLLFFSQAQIPKVRYFTICIAFSKISTAKSGMFLALCLQPAKLPCFWLCRHASLCY